MRPPKGRKKILDSAMILFEEQGYFATTIEQITKRAGVSKSLVYNYYDSKEALLIDLFEQASQTIQSHIEVLNKAKNVEESVSLFLDNFFRFLIEERCFLKLQLTLILTPEINDVLQSSIRKRAEFSLQFITNWLTQIEVSQAERKARLVIALLDGISLHYLSIFEDYPLEDMKMPAKGSLLKIIK